MLAFDTKLVQLLYILLYKYYRNSDSIKLVFISFLLFNPIHTNKLIIGLSLWFYWNNTKTLNASLMLYNSNNNYIIILYWFRKVMLDYIIIYRRVINLNKKINLFILKREKFVLCIERVKSIIILKLIDF